MNDGENIRLGTIKISVKSSAYLCQIKISSLLYLSRRYQNLSQIGRSQKCALYSISNDPNSDIDMFPPFSCGSADPNNDKSKAVIELVMAEIKLRQDVTPLNKANEVTKTIYSYSYLASGLVLQR
ncbi:hypothetical protein RhiirA1_21518 [Rhizophagus irregularis]|uniref:Uncharacterized protein n=1 Tax=Rhizophagus irregularis TaxID=588596 RepID=A0A2N0RAN6_9GLOM|nr:hypothetical protein RhiirA1_21518 [Rhizophagus irregularis]UZO18816.1 hypothetical protein OCT59_010125 [Rhizophagus irregularis]